jgi:choline dehydrogenase
VIWVRGHPADFDYWAELGCHGWDWAGVEPYFRRAEHFEQASPERGATGPVHVGKVHAQHVITDAFVGAADAAGYTFTHDYNGARQEGVGYGQANVHHGFRHSAARAYLGPAWRRRNLKVITNAFVERLLFDQRRAVGVTYRHRAQLRTARAAREIILCAGAIASPKILMLSGIGPAEHLRAHGIKVVADVAGVGQGLQEHAFVSLLFNVDVPTFGMDFTPKGIAQHGWEFLLGRGPAAAGVAHAHLFTKLEPDSRRTQIQVAFTPLALVGANAEDTKAERLSGSGTHDVTAMQILDRSTVTAHVILLHPRSRGVLELRSANPEAPPVIRHQLFADERDLPELVAGCRRVRTVFDTSPLREHVVSEALPGADVKTDDEWEFYLRSENSHTGMHPAGTCRMGNGIDAVVDPELRVREVEGIRVADTSVMPELTSGNTNAPAIMIGEKAADLVLSG